MQPQIHVNFVSIGLAVIASFIFGWLWYGPLFGKKWASLMGMKMDCPPEPKILMRSMGLTILGTFLTAYVLTHNSQSWRPSVWNAGEDAPWYMYGFFAGFFTWLGYYVPMLFGQIAWEGRKWSLFALNAAHHFLNLQMMAMILSCMS